MSVASKNIFLSCSLYFIDFLYHVVYFIKHSQFIPLPLNIFCFLPYFSPFLSWLNSMSSAALPCQTFLCLSVCAAAADTFRALPAPSLHWHSPCCWTFSAKHCVQLIKMRDLCYQISLGPRSTGDFRAVVQMQEAEPYCACCQWWEGPSFSFEGGWIAAICAHSPAGDAKCCVVQCSCLMV